MKNIFSVAASSQSITSCLTLSKVLPAGLTLSDNKLAAGRGKNSFTDISSFPWELLPQVASSEDAAEELQGRDSSGDLKTTCLTGGGPAMAIPHLLSS